MLSALATIGRRAVQHRATPIALSRAGKQLQTVRHGGDEWYYRVINTNVPKRSLYIAEGLMGLMWYWILFHCYYDYAHITGHYKYPDPSKWTDDELGVPPDDSE